jgi:hypothetical protein
MTRRKIPKLERILIVNDDSQDILAMQARLPRDVVVDRASQFQAREMQDTQGYDLIVVDNDANNLKESKGKETVQQIRTVNPDTPIIYTSFQPGWVPGEVYQTRGVEVVRTDQALDEIAKRFGIDLREAKVKGGIIVPNLNILLSYNTIGGHDAGVHTASSGEKMLVSSYDRRAGRIAPAVLANEVAKIYGTFDWTADRDIVKNIFVYDGKSGGDMPGMAAQALGHDIRMRVNMLACHCDWERKQRLANSSYVDLYQVECGGETTMGRIADVIMGIQRPGTDYSKMPISVEKIKQGTTERFRIK